MAAPAADAPHQDQGAASSSGSSGGESGWYAPEFSDEENAEDNSENPSGARDAQATPGSGVGSDAPPADAQYVEDEVLVQVDETLTPDQANAYLATLDFVATKTVTAGDIAQGLLRLSLREGTTVEEALDLLQGNPLGTSQPNFIYHTQDDTPALQLAELSAAQLTAQAATTDAYLSQQWALDAMHVPEAWEELLEDGSLSDEPLDANAVGIAVIDEGFNVNHEDLKGVIAGVYNAGTEDETKRSDVSEAPNQKSPGHGTHVVGIVGAQVNNGVGVAGVSHNARLYLTKAADDEGGINTAGMYNAYKFVLNNASNANIRVINISLGGSINPTETDKALFSKIDEAYARGIVTVCSSGNYSTPTYNYPSDYPTAVGVINVNSSFTKPSNSNYNDSSANDGAGERTKDIAAPGTNIYSTNYSTSYTDEANNRYYGNKNGTSMASPQVAGVMALIFAANPSLTADQAVQILYNTATDLNADKNLSDDDTFDYETGYGMPNAKAAVESAKASAYLEGGDSVLKGASLTYQIPTMLLFFYGTSWTWESLDPSIATVTDDGKVTGVGVGTTTISATRGTMKLSKTVAVFDPVITGVSSLAKGARTTLSVESELIGSWEWSSSDESVATVGSGTGIVRGIAPGMATITASLTTSSSVRASFDIEVTAPDNQTDETRVETAATESTPTIPVPTWSGASKVPVSASAAYAVKDGSVVIVSGSAYASLDGTTLVGKKAGKVKLALLDSVGTRRAVKTVTVYRLSGIWRLQSAAKKSLVLGTKGNSRKNGARLVLQAKTANKAQRFKLVKQQGCTYSLKSAASGKLIRAAAEGSGVFQKGTKPTKTARWQLTVDARNRIALTNASTGKVLDVKNGTARKGTKAIQRKLSTLRPTQQWTLVR